MDKVVTTLKPLFAEPMAVLMTGVAVLCLLIALGVRSFRDRILMVVLASISGMTAWMVVVRWRWW